MLRASTTAALVLLAAAVLAVELGWRTAPRAQPVRVPVPRFASGVVDELRSIPQRHVGDARAAAVVAGVAFGRADDVPAADQRAFLDSGLWHLLAASGQNVALVAACCALLARALGAGRTTGAVLALGAIPAYVLVVGSGASIVRAGLMGMLGIAAWLSGRLADLRHLLVVVAAVTCWAWPGAHRGLGMQLSFACVAALLVWAGPLTRWLEGVGVPRLLAGAAAATLLCGMATMPILHLRTGAAPLAGAVANLVAVPMAGALLVVGLAGSIAALAGDWLGVRAIGDAALAPAGLLAGLLLQVAGRAAAMPAAQVASPLVNVGVPLVALAAQRSARVRRAAPIGVLVLLVAALAPGPGLLRVHRGSAAPARADALRIAVLDVGQGDATLLAQGGRAVLVDTGPPGGRVVERVRELGVQRVDGIVLTHDSLDHRGGFEQAFSALKPTWVARPRLAPGPWRRIEQVAGDLVDVCDGDELRVGSARVQVRNPRCDGAIAPRTDDLHNDGAVVLLVEHGGVRALLPADAEAPVLLGLSLPPVDLLRVSHHGSADPRLADLLDRLRPRAAAISAGEGNDYGHPRAQVLRDLEGAGVLLRRTDEDGTVEFRSDGRRLSIVE